MRSGEYVQSRKISATPQISPTNIPRAVLLDTCIPFTRHYWHERQGLCIMFDVC